jgi:hypothetical protein
VFKPRKCSVCKDRFTPTKPLQKVCGWSCACQVAAKQRVKEITERTKADRRETRAKLEKIKPRSQHLREAQIEFNKFIRARDKKAGHPDISSDRPLDWSGNQVDAGHYRSTGAAPHLRFNEDNCHAQAKHENRYLAGNAVEYRIRLIKRIGLERVEALEADQSTKKYSIEDLKAIKAKYRALTKALNLEKA